MITENQVRELNQAISRYDVSKDVIKGALFILNNVRIPPKQIIPQEDKTIFLEWTKEGAYTFMIGIYPDCYEYLEDIGGETYRTVLSLTDSQFYEIMSFIESKVKQFAIY